jgi:acyl carrier protein
VKQRCPDQADLRSQLKHLAAELSSAGVLEPDTMSDNEALVGPKLDLDSLDTLEIAFWVEERFGIAIREHADSDKAFASIASLAAYIGFCSQDKRRSPLVFAY